MAQPLFGSLNDCALKKNLILLVDEQVSVLSFPDVWYEFSYLGGMKGLRGLDKTRTENLELKCMRKSAPAPTALTRPWNN